MISNRLHDDLLQDFKEQKSIIKEQIQIFDPLASSLRKPAAYRLVNKSILIFFEVLCYLLFLTTLAFIWLLPHVFPFSIALQALNFSISISDLQQLSESQLAGIGIYFLATLIAIQFFIMARLVRKIRLKNSVLNVAGKHIKTLVGQHLKRKAAIESIEQRHFNEIPSLANPSAPYVNEVPNPGFEEESQ
jgi:hypothetical protein